MPGASFLLVNNFASKAIIRQDIVSATGLTNLTAPAGTKFVQIEILGAGASGGRNNTGSDPGGGAGGSYGIKGTTSSSLAAASGDALAVTIAVGGASRSTNGAGTVGGATTVTGTLTGGGSINMSSGQAGAGQQTYSLNAAAVTPTGCDSTVKGSDGGDISQGAAASSGNITGGSSSGADPGAGSAGALSGSTVRGGNGYAVVTWWS